jgi:NO-binding membrane sensor protein with MHYT domain
MLFFWLEALMRLQKAAGTTPVTIWNWVHLLVDSVAGVAAVNVALHLTMVGLEDSEVVEVALALSPASMVVLGAELQMAFQFTGMAAGEEPESALACLLSPGRWV